MKDLAALALVILPLGMTMVEILAAGDTPPARESQDRMLKMTMRSGA